MKQVLIGILFSAVWASASVATKFGVESAPPLVLANIRFFIAGLILLSFSYLTKRGENYRLPNKREWRELSIFGLLNTSLYLGLYVYAMKNTAAGIGSLAVSTNPLIIVILSSFFLNRKPSAIEILSIVLGMAGIAIAAWPLLQNSYGTIGGLLLLLLSMVAVSFASVYYASVDWRLPNLLINGWQVLLGGILLLPLTLLLSKSDEVYWDIRFTASVLWLSLAVSVVGLICWFHLLRIDTVKASLWLFLCPLFGFFYAWLIMDEPISLYTITGTAMVIVALYAGQRSRFRARKEQQG